jgi:hypothetical protein
MFVLELKVVKFVEKDTTLAAAKDQISFPFYPINRETIQV